MVQKQELKKQEIYDGDNLLAFVLKNGEYPEGLKFYNRDEDFIQVGTWNYNKGQKVKAHIHCFLNRLSKRTQEMVYLKSGKMKSNIYDEKGDLLTSIILNAGDIIVYLAGGHDFEILENNTQIFEVKNGPYLGTEKDKKIINEKKPNQ